MIQLIFLSVTLLFFQLGQLGRISFFNQNVNIYVYELGMFIFILSLFIKYKFIPLTKLWKADKSFFLFFLVMLISFVYKMLSFTIGENSIGIAYFIRLLFYSIFGIYTYFYFKTDRIVHKRIESWILFFAIGIILSSFTQYFFYPDLRNLIYSGWDPHLYRLFGVFFDSSISAAVFGVFVVYFLVHSFKNKVFNKYKYVFVIIFFVLLILSYSRDVIISLLITMSIFLFRNKKIYLFVFFLLFLVFIYFIAPKSWGEGVNLKRTFSIESRINDYVVGLDLWKKAPLLGIGYNRLRYEKQHLTSGIMDNSSHAGASFHSSYLIILVTGGLFGILALLFVQYSLYIKINASHYYIFLVSIASLGDNIFLHPFILFLLCILISLTEREKKKISHP